MAPAWTENLFFAVPEAREKAWPTELGQKGDRIGTGPHTTLILLIQGKDQWGAWLGP